MFNFLQHLFTARALQSENAILQEKVKKLETENNYFRDKIEKLNQKIEQLETPNKKLPPINYPPNRYV